MSEENKNVKKEEENKGDNIQISDDVVAVISGMAATEVQGVAEMAGGFAGGISEEKKKKKNMAKGIKVEINGNDVKIDVNIIVEYGARIPDVAYEIQKRVKKSVENMTGLNATEVNVHIQGVQTAQEKKSKKKEDKKEEKPEENKVEEKNVVNKIVNKVKPKDNSEVKKPAKKTTKKSKVTKK